MADEHLTLKQCRRGHLVHGANQWTDHNGKTRCSVCRRAWANAYAAAKRGDLPAELHDAPYAQRLAHYVAAQLAKTTTDNPEVAHDATHHPDGTPANA